MFVSALVISSSPGNAVIDQSGPIWGLDKENLLRGCYRPSGHPRFWYTGGGVYAARPGSKTLALCIKAQELELWEV
ncbi:hypothetical protein C8J56DRAFT_1056095 [Mycena floridula]|nr:hypothetical protein C8J56DRAFT_1056095 [Mycena floridula]